jgi:hypothetical protein
MDLGGVGARKMAFVARHCGAMQTGNSNPATWLAEILNNP